MVEIAHNSGFSDTSPPRFLHSTSFALTKSSYTRFVHCTSTSSSLTASLSLVTDESEVPVGRDRMVCSWEKSKASRDVG